MAASVHDRLAGATDLISRRLAIVMNGSAGALLGQADAGEAVAGPFRDAGAKADIVPSDAGSLAERIALARKSGADIVVIAGGDGTIACAAQILSDGEAGPALGIVPSGTMNLLAKDLHLPVGDTAASVRALLDGEVRRIDVGEVAGHVFTCASMIGTPAKMGRHREAGRRAGGGLRAWLALARAGLRAWRRNRALRLTLVCDGQRLKVRSPSITITVNPLDDAAGRLFGRSVLDGGELCAYIVRQNTPWRLLPVLLRALTSGSLKNPGITVLRGRVIEIRSRKTALHVLVDGEARLLQPPLLYRLRPKALAVVAPA